MEFNFLKNVVQKGLPALTWMEKIPGLVRVPLIDTEGACYFVVIYKEKTRQYSIRKGDISTGAAIWEKDIVNGGYGTAAISNTNFLVHTNFSDIFALDKTTGDIIWGFQTASRIRSSISYIEDDTVVFSSGGDIFGLSDSLKGKLKWKLNEPGAFFYGRVDVDGRFVYSLGTNTDPSGRSHVYIHCFDLQTAKLAWKTDLGPGFIVSSDTSGLCWSDSRKNIFVGVMDKIVKLNPLTGAVIWSKLFSGNLGRQSLTYDDGVVYWTSSNGLVGALDINTQTGIWEYQANTMITTPVTILQSAVYFSADGELTSLSKGSGILIDKIPAGHSPYSALSTSGSNILMLGGGEPPYDGYLFCYEIDQARDSSSHNELKVKIGNNNIQNREVQISVEISDEQEKPDGVVIDVGTLSEKNQEIKLSRISDRKFHGRLELRKNIVASEYFALAKLEYATKDKAKLIPILIKLESANSGVALRHSITDVSLITQEKENYSGAALSSTLLKRYGGYKGQKDLREMVDYVKEKSGYEPFQVWRLILRRVLSTQATTSSELRQIDENSGATKK